ncbi:hypothetical protein E7Z59_07360 [Robertkochia marina]|uniref:Uncharacterized protein n=1 Tax=Robertkochia marina TaxID=1227945 RepID=A0A4S3LZF9_9FLAO|nr:hypothetical protein [Robertkochia marina]THD67471.1 hypothetical protein E7Z59_07360 [Robertkochia marina]TRZ44660.1 hypothetical protein D3A96_08590 [Robertkochia marina]
MKMITTLAILFTLIGCSSNDDTFNEPEIISGPICDTIWTSPDWSVRQHYLYIDITLVPDSIDIREKFLTEEYKYHSTRQLLQVAYGVECDELTHDKWEYMLSTIPKGLSGCFRVEIGTLNDKLYYVDAQRFLAMFTPFSLYPIAEELPLYLLPWFTEYFGCESEDHNHNKTPVL